MKIDITSLLSEENRVEEWEVAIGFDTFQSKTGSFSIINNEPFLLHGENQENKRILIHGETDVVFAVPCGRCLEETPVPMHLVIDRCYPLLEKEQDGDDVAELDGSVLDTDRLIRDEILINWPARVLCRDDCKGICPKCGTNLNKETCSCDKTEPDPRMAAFQDIFNQFKEV